MTCGGSTYYCTFVGGIWQWRDNTSCDDIDPCTYGDSCGGGGCTGTAITCDDTACMDRECNGTATCDETPMSTSTVCDTTTCPADSCGLGEWYDYPTSCTSYCTSSGTCDYCSCTSTTDTCAVGPTNQCCSATCDGLTGCATLAGTCAGTDVCTDPNTLVFGNTCTGCGSNGANGMCGGGTTAICNSSTHTMCEQVSCGGTSYRCTNIGSVWEWRAGTGCDDSNDCTYNDSCAGSTCGGTAISCGDTMCVDRECNGTSSCDVTYPSGSSCDDSNQCTYGETCDGSGGCNGGTTLDCNALDTQCSDYSCDGDSTCAVSYSTGSCDDSNLCTYGETCNGSGSCNGGTTINCDALDTDCYDYTCDGDSTCAQSINVGATCDDGNASTTGDTCQSDGSCVGSGGCVLPITYTFDTTSEGWNDDPNWEWDDTNDRLQFNFSPQIYDYAAMANTPELDLSGCSSVTVEWDVELDDYDYFGEPDASETLQVLCSGDGSSWTILAAYEDGNDIFLDDFVLVNQTAVLPLSCITATSYVGFYAEGDDSWYIDFWYVDNVELY